MAKKANRPNRKVERSDYPAIKEMAKTMTLKDIAKKYGCSPSTIGGIVGVRPKPSLRVRFFQKVEKGEPDECWEWIGAKSPKGYGMIKNNGSTFLATRVSWELHYGPIPDHDSYHGWCVCHKCDNPGCVNPDHLFLGLNSDNMGDRGHKKRTANGERHPRVKLTDDEVEQIRKLGGTMLQKDIATMFGVSSVRISLILNNKSRKHRTYPPINTE